MATNTKQTSPKVATLAGKTLGTPGASKLSKQLSGSALSQSGAGRQTGANVEAAASKALRSGTASKTNTTLGGSLVSQSNRKR